MLFDPFTVGAQIVNFLILVWLLRRVLYGPVTRAMDAREARIRRDLEDARRLQAEAASAREELQQQAAAFDAGRDTRMAEVREEIEAWRRAQMDAARAEMDASRDRWQLALEHERRAVAGELRRRVAHELVALARRALHDLADSDLDSRVTARFMARLRELGPEERERLRDAAAADGHRIHLRTPPGLDDDARTRLREAIGNAIGAQVVVHVETMADSEGGVELRAGGLKVAWSLDEYLDSLEERFNAAFWEEPGLDDAPA